MNHLPMGELVPFKFINSNLNIFFGGISRFKIQILSVGFENLINRKLERKPIKLSISIIFTRKERDSHEITRIYIQEKEVNQALKFESLSQHSIYFCKSSGSFCQQDQALPRIDDRCLWRIMRDYRFWEMQQATQPSLINCFLSDSIFYYHSTLYLKEYSIIFMIY